MSSRAFEAIFVGDPYDAMKQAFAAALASGDEKVQIQQVARLDRALDEFCEQVRHNLHSSERGILSKVADG